MDFNSRIIDELAEHRVHLQNLRGQMEQVSVKLDTLLLWQREVKAQLKITAAIASVLGGGAGFLINFLFT